MGDFCAFLPSPLMVNLSSAVRILVLHVFLLGLGPSSLLSLSILSHAQWSPLPPLTYPHRVFSLALLPHRGCDLGHQTPRVQPSSLTLPCALHLPATFLSSATLKLLFKAPADLPLTSSGLLSSSQLSSSWLLLLLALLSSSILKLSFFSLEKQFNSMHIFHLPFRSLLPWF